MGGDHDVVIAPHVQTIPPTALDPFRIRLDPGRPRPFVPQKLASGILGAWPLAEAGEEASLAEVIEGMLFLALAHGEAGGRYSPTRERGVHHFHRLLCELL